MIPVEEVPPLDQDRRQFIRSFYERTEYGPSDVLSYSLHTGMFLTRNGGRYKLNGEDLEHLSGPSADPSERI